jgi:ribosome maturation factor RimP
MDLGEKIRQLIPTLLTDESLFLVSVTVSALTGPQKVTVALDGDNGVTIDDCATLSRSLAGVLEEQGLIGDNFTLEVTTPGVDKPLLLKRQYVKNVGRGLKVYRKDKSILEGKLKQVTGEDIVLEQESGEGKKKEVKDVALPLADIEKALVQISFK